jgi:PST family polysaccharide transporter
MTSARPGEINRVVANSGWMIAEHTCKAIAGIYISVLLARHLGPDGLGTLNFALAYAGLFAVIATGGLSRILVRDLAKNEQDSEASLRLMNTAFTARALISLAVLCLSLLFAVATSQPNLLLILVVCSSIVFSTTDVLDLFYQSRSQSRRPILVKLLVLALMTGLRTLLVWRDADVIWFGIAAAVEAAFVAAGLLSVYLREGFALNHRLLDRTCARRLLTEGWPEIFAGLGAATFARVDQVMLANMADTRAVGVYSVAVRLSESWYFIVTAIVASSFPIIVRLRESDPGTYILRVEQLMRTLVAISYAAIAVTWIAGPYVIDLLYGEEFAQSASILTIHITSGLFVALGLASGSWLVAEGKTQLNLWRNLLGALVNVALNFALIPRLGANGAAYASLVGAAAAYFFFDFLISGPSKMWKVKFRSLLLFSPRRSYAGA